MSIALLDRKFGAVPRHFLYVTDQAGALTARQARQLEHWLQYFERKFPQVRFSVFFVSMALKVPVAEYAFWLFNRGRFSPSEAKFENNYSILLTVDTANAAAALTVGYGLEGLLDEETLQHLLDVMRESFQQGKFYQGVMRCGEELIPLLKRLSTGIPPAPAIAKEPAGDSRVMVPQGDEKTLY